MSTLTIQALDGTRDALWSPMSGEMLEAPSSPSTEPNTQGLQVFASATRGNCRLSNPGSSPRLASPGVPFPKSGSPSERTNARPSQNAH